MTASQDRVTALFREHLDPDRDPDYTVGLGDSGVSSVDAIEFVKKVGEAFGAEIPPAQVAEFRTLGDLVSYLDSHGN